MQRRSISYSFFVGKQSILFKKSKDFLTFYVLNFILILSYSAAGPVSPLGIVKFNSYPSSPFGVIEADAVVPGKPVSTVPIDNVGITPSGIVKSNTISPSSPTFSTEASVPGSPVVTVPTLKVGVAPVGPVSPVKPVGPVERFFKSLFKIPNYLNFSKITIFFTN